MPYSLQGHATSTTAVAAPLPDPRNFWQHRGNSWVLYLCLGNSVALVGLVSKAEEGTRGGMTFSSHCI